MSDDDWGIGDEEPKKEPETPNPPQDPPKETDKEEPNADVDQQSSWIVEKSNIEPDKKVEERSRSRGRRNEEKIVTVEEKAEELKPDKKDESFWGDANAEKKEEEEQPARTGRGRGNREGQEEGGRGFNRNYGETGRGNREEEGAPRGRGNRGDGGGERGNRGEERGNRGEGERGNRGDGQRGNRGDGQRGNRGDGERGGYGGGYRGDRGGDRGDRGDRGGRPWDNRGDRDGERGRGRGRGRGGFFNDRNFNNGGQEEAKVAEKVVLLPKGRKCWPESSIYIFGVKLSVTFRRIHDFKCKLLVVPFKTPRLEYYPGTIVNQSKVNYKEKIARKDDLKVAGETYFQKAHEIAGFEAIAFLKIDDAQLEDSLKKGVKQVFERIEVIAEVALESVVLCVSPELGSPLPVIHQAIECLQETQKVKEFYINTASSGCFLECLSAFREEMQQLFDENEISLE